MRLQVLGPHYLFSLQRENILKNDAFLVKRVEIVCHLLLKIIELV